MTLSRPILGVRVDATTYDEAVGLVGTWAKIGDSRFVTAAAAYNLVHAQDDPRYRALMNGADLVTPDGMPLVWALRALGIPHPSRVYGPDLTWKVCEMAARENIPVGFYGATETVLDRLTEELHTRFPSLNVAYRYSPPFRALSLLEEAKVDEAIKDSGASIVFVGLGAPKQDQWIALRQGILPAVMLGVGAAFDFLAGTKPQAPIFVRRIGFEWLFRLLSEPRRLWRRYLIGNPRFVWHFARQLLGRARSSTNHRAGELEARSPGYPRREK